MSANQRAAEQAVVRQAIRAGYLSMAQVEAARAEAGGAPLLPLLSAQLSPAQQAELRAVYQEALGAAAASAAPPATPGGGWSHGWSESWTPGDAALPTEIGPYRITKELGRGGMGVVALAYHRDVGRAVALKLQLDDEGGDPEGSAKRFQREAQAVAALRHPGIVQVHDYGQEGRRRYMALELVQGGSLEERLEREGQLPAREVARLGAEVAAALACAHAAGIV
ncbi:MAG TPA: hypothetical protein DEA08_10885, partial [Planctomycetes bacterium]|nr:hypothetical protein [Planctomycetota bacterium]